MPNVSQAAVLLCVCVFAAKLLDCNCYHIEPTEPPRTGPLIIPSSNGPYCYRKSFGDNGPRKVCKAKSFGCYETERYINTYTIKTKIKLGCLKKPCQPLDRFFVRRRCCNTTLCNNLHERGTLFTPPPPPTLPPLDPVEQPYRWIYCYCESCQNKSCASTIGCYTVLQATVKWSPAANSYYFMSPERVIERSCINMSTYGDLCLSPSYLLNREGQRAECCFKGHYCNNPPTPLPPWRSNYNRSNSSATTPLTYPTNLPQAIIDYWRNQNNTNNALARALMIYPESNVSESTVASDYQNPTITGYLIFGLGVIYLLILVILVVSCSMCLCLKQGKNDHSCKCLAQSPPPRPPDNKI